ncbi:response regulator [Clostridium sp. YIM B02505]|uniref:Stage 0 sporulation protein A homolog n=1 Tax=Clostridium yunnanense TaxID=2800325 RepID=A0ABS1EX22_9CLOT|nr:response regulator [Clostridium yunnanense]MBK1813939.1 response regulator [Clostridium yunnanense]
MKKVLIVDDEKFIRNGLESIIKRKYEEKYETILCSNGIDALEKVKSEDIFFVITDIRMPECDGIEFLKRLNNEELRIPTLILSGYDDFNYAVEALRYGAKDYLLKPIKKNELYESIEKIEKEYNQAMEDINKINIELVNDISNRFNIILLNERVSDETVKEELGKLCQGIDESSYYLAVLFNKDLMMIPEQERNEKYDELLNAVMRQQEKISAFVDNQGNLNIIYSDINAITDIRNWINDNKKYGFCCGVSNNLIDFNQFRLGYKNAILALKSNLIYKENKQLTTYEYVLEKSKNFVRNEVVEKLINLIGTKRRDKMIELLQAIYAEEVVREQGIVYLERSNEKLLKSINRYVQQQLNSNLELKNKLEFVSSILNFNNYREFYYELKELVLYVDELLFEMRRALCDKSFIGKAIEYINNNYSKNLSLTVVSNVVSVNYSYFSQVFKEHTGENFINYLRNIRVKKAQELLKEQELKVYEVAEAVGYSDSKQFTKAFKSVTGITPQEFKEKQFIN